MIDTLPAEYLHRRVAEKKARMTKPNIEEIVARWEQTGAIISQHEIDALIAAWREAVSAGQRQYDENVNQIAKYAALEAVRAKCEAIADGMAVSHSGMGPIEMRRKIRDAIAALKDKP
jgi:hypothetical protein